MKTRKQPETCPCKICGTPTTMTGTRLCDPCWTVTSGIQRFSSLPKGRAFLTGLLEPEPADKFNLLELLQDGGDLPNVTVKNACTGDWHRILMDAQADLTRQLCFYMEPGNERRVNHYLTKIEWICQQWRKKGPKE